MAHSKPPFTSHILPPVEAERSQRRRLLGHFDGSCHQGGRGQDSTVSVWCAPQMTPAPQLSTVTRQFHRSHMYLLGVIHKKVAHIPKSRLHFKTATTTTTPMNEHSKNNEEKIQRVGFLRHLRRLPQALLIGIQGISDAGACCL